MKKKVCLNCREELGWHKSKYCTRCAPHVKRMNDKARFKTKIWSYVSKKCPGCGEIKARKEFGRKTDTSRRTLCCECYKGRKILHEGTRRARKLSLPNTLTLTEWERALGYWEWSCAYCGMDRDLHQEHFIPVAKGGGYTASNLVPSCPQCNFSKKDTHPLEWLIEKDGGLLAYTRVYQYLEGLTA